MGLFVLPGWPYYWVDYDFSDHVSHIYGWRRRYSLPQCPQLLYQLWSCKRPYVDSWLIVSGSQLLNLWEYYHEETGKIRKRSSFVLKCLPSGFYMHNMDLVDGQMCNLKVFLLRACWFWMISCSRKMFWWSNVLRLPLQYSIKVGRNVHDDESNTLGH